MVVESEMEDLRFASKALREERTPYFAQVFWKESGKPAVDFDAGVQTTVTYWEKNHDLGVRLESISHEGNFHTPLSARELVGLTSGDAWMTLTAGNYQLAADAGHPRLPFDFLFDEKALVVPFKISKPRVYYGRLLFEDGLPAVLDPEPWPGGKMAITFPFVGSVNPDKEGYFEVFLSAEQFKELVGAKARKNIYVPSYTESGRSSARHAFPAGVLGTSKVGTGEVRIPRPLPKG